VPFLSVALASTPGLQEIMSVVPFVLWFASPTLPLKENSDPRR
jgi:hypothetical protein